MSEQTAISQAPEQPVSSFSDLTDGGMRPVMRSMALSALAMMWQRTGRIDAALRTNRVHILNLHHVFADEEESFRRLLRRLRPHHAFISYSEAIERIVTGEINRPYITFTFDDGLKSCVRAVRVMREFKAKACFFVCPPIIGETDPEAIRRFCHEGMREPVHEFMDWDDLQWLINEGHEVGSHTMTHPDMATLDARECVEELRQSWELLGKRLGAVKHFAWPFGRFAEFSAEAARAVFDCGYHSCASGVRGCHRSRQALQRRQLCVRREHIVADWPLAHSMLFIARSARVELHPEELWPAGWDGIVQGSGE